MSRQNRMERNGERLRGAGREVRKSEGEKASNERERERAKNVEGLW
jgi:hypothetical protein